MYCRAYSKRSCVIVLLIRLFAKTDNLDISLDSPHEFRVSYKIGIALCVLAQYIVIYYDQYSYDVWTISTTQYIY